MKARISNSSEGKKSIKDNPSTKKFKEDLEGMSALFTLTNMFGITQKEDMPDIDKIKNDLEKLSRLPDDFNSAFARKGWIAYESFSVPVMEKAVELFKKGDEKAAENEIMTYYSVNNIRMMIVGRGGAVEAYKPRKQLALYALNEYEAERYYSCVPLLLMIIDGLVNDISKEAGFFADKTDVTSWDSIVGHYTGLTQLKSIYNKSRKKTNTEEITMPYRHGILHGRDLNYNNISVATKCWGCLAAVLDWGKDIANGKKVPPPPEKPKTLSENLNELKDTISIHQENKKNHKIFNEKLDKWKPRNIKLDIEQMKNVSTASLSEYSPEKALIEFIELWKKSNYGFMANFICFDPKYEPKSNVIKTLRRIFDHKNILDYSIVSIEDKAPIISHITLSMLIEHDKNKYSKEIEFRMIYEGDNVIHGDKGGQWKLVNGYHHIEYME